MSAISAVPIKPPGQVVPLGGTQLELSLFAPSEQTPTALIIPFEPRVDWSDKAVTDLREGILHHSLRVLADGRVGEIAKVEAMDWMMSDEIHPFSFVVCCSEFGYVPVEVRERTLNMLARLEKKSIKAPQEEVSHDATKEVAPFVV